MNLRLIVAAILSMTVATAAQAGSVAFRLEFRSVPTAQFEVPQPQIKLIDTSTQNAITYFEIGVGNTAANYHTIYQTIRSSTAIVVTPSQSTDGTKKHPLRVTSGSTPGHSNFLVYQYSNFLPSRSVAVTVDLDADNLGPDPLFDRTLFNNGTAPNASYGVKFSNGIFLSGSLPDLTKNTSGFYSLSRSQTVSLTAAASQGSTAIPLPNAVWTGAPMLAMLPALQFLRRRWATAYRVK